MGYVKRHAYKPAVVGAVMVLASLGAAFRGN